MWIAGLLLGGLVHWANICYDLPSFATDAKLDKVERCGNLGWYCSRCASNLVPSEQSSGYAWRYQCALRLYSMRLTPLEIWENPANNLREKLYQDFLLRISNPSKHLKQSCSPCRRNNGQRIRCPSEAQECSKLQHSPGMHSCSRRLILEKLQASSREQSGVDRTPNIDFVFGHAVGAGAQSFLAFNTMEAASMQHSFPGMELRSRKRRLEQKKKSLESALLATEAFTYWFLQLLMTGKYIPSQTESQLSKYLLPSSSKGLVLQSH